MKKTILFFLLICMLLTTVSCAPVENVPDSPNEPEPYVPTYEYIFAEGIDYRCANTVFRKKGAISNLTPYIYLSEQEYNKVYSRLCLNSPSNLLPSGDPLPTNDVIFMGKKYDVVRTYDHRSDLLVYRTEEPTDYYTFFPTNTFYAAPDSLEIVSADLTPYEGIKLYDENAPETEADFRQLADAFISQYVDPDEFTHVTVSSFLIASVKGYHPQFDSKEGFYLFEEAAEKASQTENCEISRTVTFSYSYKINDVSTEKACYVSIYADGTLARFDVRNVNVDYTVFLPLEYDKDALDNDVENIIAGLDFGGKCTVTDYYYKYRWRMINNEPRLCAYVRLDCSTIAPSDQKQSEKHCSFFLVFKIPQ